MSDWLPDVDLLEASASSVHAEVDRLLETARAELRRLQDYDAELADAGPTEMTAVRAARQVTRHRLRAITRQFTIAHAELVPVTDRLRFAAAQRVKAWASEGQRADPPYLVEATG